MSGAAGFPDSYSKYASLARGVDVSHWHVVKDWDVLKKSSISFIGIKATEGNKTVDSALAQHRDGARAAKFDMAIYYHFARSGDAKAQANRFMAAVGPLLPNEFLCLDLEVLVADPNLMLKWLDDFYSTLNARYSDRRHFIYTSKRVWNMFGNPLWPSSSRQPFLWAPRYNGNGDEPAMPAPWTSNTRGWAIWQWTDGETPAYVAPGIGPCDANLWFGDQSDLLDWVSEFGPKVQTVAEKKLDVVVEFVRDLNDRQFGVLRDILTDDTKKTKLLAALLGL